MDRWGIYEVLKGNREFNIKDFEKTPASEVKEGVIEYLLARDKSKASNLNSN